MDHAYAVEKLTEFIEDVNGHLGELEAATSPDIGAPWPDWPEELNLQLVRARQIMNAYVPGLGDTFDEEDGDARYWFRVRAASVEALGRATFAEEIADFLRPTSPAIAADGLHSWAWEPAAPLWAAEARQDAVLAAARTLNRRLQQKLDRHDIGETDLCMQSFDLKDPVEGKPRLRFPGDRATPTWRARQEGSKYLSAGAFLALRNLAAHEDEVAWTEQEALEHLAVLSVIARWIEECSVEVAQ
ncbi:TIGR02391 family protein [Streptomyces sp. NPDC003300]|uniref:TIGR02391 family protein n=1 Tax=unclassified Streptomyces TaxID=2593676 RepID=UPI0033B31EE5